jgi:CDP-diacylglycerol--serine O-phosphatidyltransferase
MSQKRKKRAEARRAIFLLPNLFTTFSLFAGFYSIVSSIQGRFTLAAWAIFIAAILDALDGTVARMTKTTSLFGVEYDSLCDLVSFGVAPAVLVYQWALKPSKLQLINKYVSDEKTFTLGMVVAFVFLACGALRLARFNVSTGHRDPGFFQGLPIPGGAFMISAIVLWYHRNLGVPLDPNPIFVVPLVLVLAFLMVSTLDYFSLKHRFITKNNHPFETLVLIILFLALIITKAKTLLLPLGLVYLATGPIVTVIRRNSTSSPAPPALEDIDSSKELEINSSPNLSLTQNPNLSPSPNPGPNTNKDMDIKLGKTNSLNSDDNSKGN